MSGSILTLCESCSVLLQDGFRVTRIPHQITTEKKKICQRCKKKYRDDLLSQYTVTARSKRDGWDIKRETAYVRFSECR